MNISEQTDDDINYPHSKESWKSSDTQIWCHAKDEHYIHERRNDGTMGVQYEGGPYTLKEAIEAQKKNVNDKTQGRNS